MAVLKTFIAATSDDEASFAVSVCRIDNPELTLEDLQSDSELKKFVTFERNARIATDSFDDPLLPQQWALAKLGATEPWTVTPTGGKTIVAIVDSGLRRPDGTVHEDLGTVEALVDCQPQPIAIGGILLPRSTSTASIGMATARCWPALLRLCLTTTWASPPLFPPIGTSASFP